ncbi:hypothetical protein, partial [uncultured Rikenella sp.]|uniref:hypothetical protein n=1 Tax=uncultured Rikenella sp. TaxID=368003 RepID=UPI0027120904
GTRKMSVSTPNRRPLGFHLDFAHRKTSEIPFYAGGRRIFRMQIEFFVRAPARFIYIRLPPKQLNRLFRRWRAVELCPA